MGVFSFFSRSSSRGHHCEGHHGNGYYKRKHRSGFLGSILSSILSHSCSSHSHHHHHKHWSSHHHKSRSWS